MCGSMKFSMQLELFDFVVKWMTKFDFILIKKPPDPEEWQSVGDRCAIMSSVSLTFSKEKRKRLEKQQHQFSRSCSLSNSSSTERRLSFDDLLDEKEEDCCKNHERTSSLSRLTEHQDDYARPAEHRSRQTSRTSSTETMSSSDRKCLFSKRQTSETSSSLTSLTKEVTISSKAVHTKSSQSAQNLHQTDTNETKGKSSQISLIFQRSKQTSPSPCRPPQHPPKPMSTSSTPDPDNIQMDLDLLMEGVESPELELAMGRIIGRMDSLGDCLKANTSARGALTMVDVDDVFVEITKTDGRRCELDILQAMNDLIRRAWAVSTIGYDLGSGLCKSMLKKGVLDILLKNLTSDDCHIQFQSARLLEQSLTIENRNYVVRNGLKTVVRAACDCSRSPCIEKSRIGMGILEHLFKNSEETCREVIRLGGLSAILYECRNCDVETLRHCAAALCNLSLHGGPENQEAMIQHKASEWLFPLAFHLDDNIKYYACLAIAVLVANKEIEAAVLRSGTLDLVEPFVTSHSPEEFAKSTVAHVHGQSKSWLIKLVPVLDSKREEARSLAAFHFAMEAGIKKRQGNTNLFHEIGVVGALKRVASSPNAIASKYSAHALLSIGESVPHKLSQQVPLWTVEDVVEWVKQINFSRYSQEFQNSKVDGDLLLKLTEKSLKEDILMTNGILRKRFLRELNRLKRLADYSSCDCTGVNAFLANLEPEFCQYTYQMIQSGVRLCNLRELSDEQLQNECTIENSIHRKRIMQASKGPCCGPDVSLHDGENPKSIDVFISYRRSNGSQLASLLKVHLALRGYRCFIDVERLEAGKFDENLLMSVRQARHFVLVLSSNALDRCVKDTDRKDWVHREIAEALDSNCNIIPVLDNFQWPDLDLLPDDMKALPFFNGVSWIHDYQDACIDKLERFMRGEKDLIKSIGTTSPSTPGTPKLVPRSLPHNSQCAEDS